MTKKQLEQVDYSIAKQLQRSMELNARMKNRLQELIDNWPEEYSEYLIKIINDQDLEL